MSLLKELKYRIYSIPFYALLLLPLPVLYLLSDVLYVLLYNVIRYRRKVVQMNLLNSFPDKDEKERARIEKAYYHSMIDVFIESC
jgi:KDO2-lipid IV(A) lauroyltransferase